MLDAGVDGRPQMWGRPFSHTGNRILESLGPDFRANMSREIILNRASEDFVNDLFGWSDLNSLLDRRSVMPAELQLSQNGEVLSRELYADAAGSLDLFRLKQEVRGGASIILDGLDRVSDRVREVTTAIMQMTGETASCNMFVTFHSSQAFHSHFDEVDTIIVQLEGSKHWQVHGPGEPDPLPEHGDSDPRNCPEGALLDTVLKPGDVLHVPRGWWHTVRGAGDKSIHLTFAFTRKTGLDYIRWLAWKSIADPRVRQSLDRWGSESSRQSQTLDVLRAFSEIASKFSVDDFFEEERAAVDGWQASSFPWSVTEDGLAGSVSVRLLAVFKPVLSRNESSVFFTFAGEKVTLPLAYTPAVEFIWRNESATVTEIAEGSRMPQTAVANLVKNLERIGLLKLS
ncbi:JmjC domain-containing protein [Microbacterium sp. SORGH_AS_0421]|uniref:JmjC domain-containing protein n=1 Tax=Microbacterium sp. SORGH_AS_0421 TaxID=3041768 RepID=UPI0027950C6B|nr:cupin domain-containing protein [Microbacterium sp. SORGH_AS_0421]MDQ1177764.1 oxalate decarboxylase/phosphoglucose isomerase-like protein (cupin superfamily) [Microbacterium sp. SORGH_AS_0421]